MQIERVPFHVLIWSRDAALGGAAPNGHFTHYSLKQKEEEHARTKERTRTRTRSTFSLHQFDILHFVLSLVKKMKANWHWSLRQVKSHTHVYGKNKHEETRNVSPQCAKACGSTSVKILLLCPTQNRMFWSSPKAHEVLTVGLCYDLQITHTTPGQDWRKWQGTAAKLVLFVSS